MRMDGPTDEHTAPADPADADARAMAAVAAGDADAFEALVARYQDGVYRYFLRMGLTPSDAEDCAQDTFIRIYARAGEYAPTARFTTYLYRVAHNRAIDFFRRRRRRTTESLDRPVDGGAATAADRLAAPPEPETPLERAENEAWRRALLKDAVAALPERERAVFALAGPDGLPYADIAAALGIPVGTVKSRMHAAVHRMRDFLKRRGLHG